LDADTSSSIREKDQVDRGAFSAAGYMIRTQRKPPSQWPRDTSMTKRRVTPASQPHVLRSKFMGHTSITATIDRNRHLLPGGEAEAADLLNEYHARRRRSS
jgi:hypothetical protein